MGNQLAALAPIDFYDINEYVADIKTVQFNSMMGKSRFLKSIKVSHAEGFLTLKIFIVPNNFSIKIHKDQIQYIKEKLNHIYCFLPYNYFDVKSSRAAYIHRQYIKYNLYDRINTRPFLCDTEKIWITYQFLYALQLMHEKQIYHGDIKCENILLSSWNYLFLTDFASFKPVLIPEDNPSDFTYFFDSSQRHQCYIAPERFYNIKDNRLFFTDKMDIFSAGCTLLQLFSGGFFPFNSRQLILFKNKRFFPHEILYKITNLSVRYAISRMLSLNENLRPNANQVVKIILNDSKVAEFIFINEYFSVIKHYNWDEKIISIADNLERLEMDVNMNLHKIILISFLLAPLKTPNTDDCLTIETFDLKFVDSYYIVFKCLQKWIKFDPDYHKFMEIKHLMMENIVPHIMYIFSQRENPDFKLKYKCLKTLCHIHATLLTGWQKYHWLLDKSDIENTNYYTDFVLYNMIRSFKDANLTDNYSYIFLIIKFLIQSAANIQEIIYYLFEHINEFDYRLNRYAFFETMLVIENQFSKIIVQYLIGTGTYEKYRNFIRKAVIYMVISKFIFVFRRYMISNVLVSHSISFFNDINDRYCWEIYRLLPKYILGTWGGLTSFHNHQNQIYPLLYHGFEKMDCKLSVLNAIHHIFSVIALPIKICMLLIPFVIQTDNTQGNRKAKLIVRNTLKELKDLEILIIYILLQSFLVKQNKINVPPLHEKNYEDYIYLINQYYGIYLERFSPSFVSFEHKKIQENNIPYNILKPNNNKAHNENPISSNQRNNAAKNQDLPNHNQEWTELFETNNNINGFQSDTINLHINQDDSQNRIVLSQSKLRLYNAKDCFTINSQPTCTNSSDIHKVAHGKHRGHLWRPKGNPIFTLPNHAKHSIRFKSHSAHSLLPCLQENGKLYIYDVNSLVSNTFSKPTLQKDLDTHGQSLCWLNETNLIAAGCKSIYSVDLAQEKVIKYNMGREHSIMEVMPMSNNAVIYLKQNEINGFDMRSGKSCFSLNVSNTVDICNMNNFHEQIGSSICIDVNPSMHFMVNGTTNGFVIGWDMRFLMPVINFHASQTPIRHVRVSKDPAKIFCAPSYNEISKWDIYSLSREKTFWFNTNPPLTETDSTQDFIAQIYYENDENYMLIASTDSCVRYWDLTNPEKSYALKNNVKYDNRLIDGIEVLIEQSWDAIRSKSYNNITKILTNEENNLLITSTIDGNIQFWK